MTVARGMRLKVNGRSQAFEADGDMPLLWALRDRLGLTGTKYGCGVALCGACTVHLDGEAVRACAVTLDEVGGRAVTTIEGLGGPAGEAVKAAWIFHEVAQCGYCQPGQVMTAAALLRADPNPDAAAIEAAMTGNVCRCATYVRIRAAVLTAARALRV